MVTDRLTYTHDSISGYASSRQVATKMILRQHYCIILAASLLFLPKIRGAGGPPMFLYIGQCHNNSFDNLKYKPLVCKNNIAKTFPFCWLVT